MSKNIKLVIASTRQNRVGPQVATWVAKTAAEAGVNLEVLDLKTIDLPAFDAPVPPLYAPTETKQGKNWAEIVNSTDAFVFVTPEYNRSIPSSLKNALDYLVEEWKAKPAVIVSYGYIDGGQSSAAHLTDILSWLKMDVVKPAVSLQLAQDQFTPEGTFKDVYASFDSNADALHKAVTQLV